MSNTPGAGFNQSDSAEGFAYGPETIEFLQNFKIFKPTTHSSAHPPLPRSVKSRDSATNCVWDLRGFAFDNARIDTPYDGVHDGMGARHLQLVLAIDLLPKRRRPYRVLNVR
jgi:hypothetical protein